MGFVTHPLLEGPVMAFTVGLPNGARDFEYEAYVRMLERDGIDIANTPRVHDPGTGKRWLYAWADRADAEAFADRLRVDTENPDWQVYELPGVAPSTGPLGPVELLVSRQSEGFTYGLHPLSRTGGASPRPDRLPASSSPQTPRPTPRRPRRRSGTRSPRS
jgi:hypothetical protein